ncbi:centromere-associated protein E-like [Hydractinia symbiolongicarpus]|uniref:centromere-associated protein E-like n=1 Tax=Hydractinia symbiolongicarpus TaxID=13093 RepID=UPI00254B2E5F|nr:centromere-associated protein E-like [Hydractinia symbiolongicarpus]
MHTRSNCAPDFYQYGALFSDNTRVFLNNQDSFLDNKLCNAKTKTSKSDVRGFGQQPEVSKKSPKERIEMFEANQENRVRNQQNIQEVSRAMKEYIQDAESREQDLKMKITHLETKNKQSHETLRELEKTIKQERKTNKVNVAQLEQNLKGKVANMERLLNEKDKECERLINNRDELKSKLLHLKRDKMHYTSEIDIREGVLKEELRSLKNAIELQNSDKLKCDDEWKCKEMTISKLKAIEAELSSELQKKSKILKQKEEVIEALTDEIERRKNDSLTKLAKTEQELKSLSDQNKILKKQLKNLNSCIQEKEKVCKELQDNVDFCSEQRVCLINDKDVQTKRIEELKKENECSESALQKCKEDLHISVNENKELKLREKTLQSEIVDLKKSLSERSRMSVDVFDKYAQEICSMREKNLKNEEAYATKQKLQASTEQCCRLKKENNDLQMSSEQLKEKYKDAVEMLQRKLAEAKESSAMLRSDMESLIAEKEDQKMALQRLGFDLSESRRLNVSCTKKIRFLTQRCEKLKNISKELKNCQKENDELRLRLKQKSADSQESENAMDMMTINDCKLRETLNKREKQMEDLKDDNEKLTTELKTLNEMATEYVQKQIVYDNKIKQMYQENTHLNACLLGLKAFMVNTKGEIQEMQAKNEETTKSNEELNEYIEHLEVRMDIKVQEIETYQQELQQCSDILNTYQREWQHINQENNNLMQAVANAEQGVLKSTSEFREKLTDKTELAKHLKEKLCCKEEEAQYFKKQCYELISNVDEIQQQLVATLKVVDEQKRDIQLLNAENRKIKLESDQHKQKMELFKEETLQLRNQKQEQLKQFSENTADIRDSEIQKMKEKLRSVNHENEELRRQFQILKIKCGGMSTNNENMTIEVTSLHDEIVHLKNERDNLQAHVDKMKKRVSEMEHKNHELTCQLQHSKDCMEEIKNKNIDLHNILQNKKDREKFCREAEQNRNTTFKDIENENAQLKVSKKSLEEKISVLKATVTELQGVLNGNTYKHSWIMQHNEDQVNEIKALKKDLSDYHRQALETKERFFKVNFENEKLTEDLQTTRTQLKFLENENENIRRNSTTALNQEKLRINNLQEQLDVLSESKKQNTAMIQTLKKEREDFVKEIYEENCNLKILNEKYESSIKKIEEMNQKEKQYQSKQKKNGDRLNNMKNEFFKLISLFKKIKQERDSLKAFLLTSEKEKSHFKEKIQHMMLSSGKLQKQLEEFQHLHKSTLSDNEKMKSRLSILNYTERTRDSEYKEMTKKLQQYQKKIEQLTMQVQNTSPHEETTTDKSKENPAAVSCKLVEELKSLIFRQPRKKCRLSKECAGMNTLLQTFKTHNTKPITDKEDHSFNRKSKFDGSHVKIKRHRFKLARDRENQERVNNLYKESQAIQDFLIREMSKLSRHYPSSVF